MRIKQPGLPRQMKQQSAMEFVTTYSWAILVVSLLVAIVAVISLSKAPAGNLASTCNIQPSLPCSGTVLSYNAINPLHFELLFTNNLGVTMYFPYNGFNVTTTNIGASGVEYSIGNCTPSIATPGTQVLCMANIAGSLKPQVGTQTSTLFTLSYELCKGNTQSSCQSSIYKSTGSSLQTLAPSSTNLYTITFVTCQASGMIALNGVTYVNNAVSYFTSQSYNAYALPPQGYTFNSWTISSASSTLSNTVTQSTVLTLNSNAVITASCLASSVAPTTTISVSTSTTTTTTTSTSSTSTTVIELYGYAVANPPIGACGGGSCGSTDAPASCSGGYPSCLTGYSAILTGAYSASVCNPGGWMYQDFYACASTGTQAVTSNGLYGYAEVYQSCGTYSCGTASSPAYCTGAGSVTCAPGYTATETGTWWDGPGTCNGAVQIYYFYSCMANGAAPANAWPYALYGDVWFSASCLGSAYYGCGSYDAPGYCSGTGPISVGCTGGSYTAVETGTATANSKCGGGSYSYYDYYSCMLSTALTAGTPTASLSNIDSGQSTTLSANPTGGGGTYTSYQWYSDGACSSAIGGATSNSYATPALTTTTTYSYTVTNSTSFTSYCSPGTVITVNPVLWAGVPTASPNPVDSGQSATLYSVPSGGTGSYTGYQWYSDGSCVSAIGGATSSTHPATLTLGTTYSYTVTDSFGVTSACSGPGSWTVYPALAVSLANTGPFTYNAGQTPTALSASVTSGGSNPGLSYIWYVASSAACPSSGTSIGTSNTYTPTANSVTPSYYCTKVTDSESGSAYSATAATVTLPTYPQYVLGVSNTVGNLYAITPSGTYYYSGSWSSLGAIIPGASLGMSCLYYSSQFYCMTPNGFYYLSGSTWNYDVGTVTGSSTSIMDCMHYSSQFYCVTPSGLYYLSGSTWQMQTGAVTGSSSGISCAWVGSTLYCMTPSGTYYLSGSTWYTQGAGVVTGASTGISCLYWSGNIYCMTPSGTYYLSGSTWYSTGSTVPGSSTAISCTVFGSYMYCMTPTDTYYYSSGWKLAEAAAPGA